MPVRRPGPLLTRILRAPAQLYDLNAGWLLGERFLRLTHVGRRSGQEYQTMLEVIGHDPERQEFAVLAGLGSRANWYRNLEASPAIEVAVGRQRFRPAHRVLSVNEAATALAGYEHRNRFIAPVVRRAFSWLVGWTYDGSDRARQRLVRELPVVALRPAEDADRSSS